jgi:hypothetical protein
MGNSEAIPRATHTDKPQRVPASATLQQQTLATNSSLVRNQYEFQANWDRGLTENCFSSATPTTTTLLQKEQHCG